MFGKIALFYSLFFSSAYAMQLELVPLLHEKDANISKEKSVELDDHKQIQRNNNSLLENMGLVPHIPDLSGAKNENNAQDKINVECMIKLDEKKTDQEIIVDYQKKVALQQKTITSLQKEIRELIQKKYQNPGEIKCDVNGCIETARVGAAGGCCGAMTGAGGMCIYGEIEGYMWCCCGIAPPKMLAWNTLAWGCPISMGSGCLIGLLCAVCGVHRRIRCDL